MPELPVVYFDANPLGERHLTGIGRYTARLAIAARGHAQVRFFAGRWELLPPDNLDWSQDQDLAQWAKRVSRSRRQPLDGIPENSLGVWCCLRPVERWFPVEMSILYDFTPLILPQTHTRRTHDLFAGYCSHSLLSTDLALAISHSTKADASWLTDLDPSRVFVSHPGPSLCVHRHLSSRSIDRRPNVGLVVSTLEPRKNAALLIEWFQQSRALPADAELWWVGPRGWLTTRRQLRRYGRGGNRRVRMLGTVSDERLCELTREAGWSVYPSLYEGFGFPVLDALRHGTPVLAGRHSSVREFDVPGVFFFNPRDIESIDAAWQEHQTAMPVAIDQVELERRYNWDNVARALIDAYTEHLRARPATARVAA